MKYTTLPAVRSLQDETIVYAVMIGLIAILLAILVAFLIPYKGAPDRSYILRRIWFVVIGVLAVLGFFIYNDQFVKPNINNVGWQEMFSGTNFKCIFINAGVYIVVGIILMFVFKHKKFGTILPKKFKN